MDVNKRLKHLRKEILKLTQEEFSNKINITRSNLGSIEIGRIKLTERVASDICREWSVNEEWLLNGIEPIFVDSRAPLVNHILEIFKTLNEDNKKYLQGYAIRLLEEQKTKEDSANDELSADKEKEIEIEGEAYKDELRLEANMKTSKVSPKCARKSIS